MPVVLGHALRRKCLTNLRRFVRNNASVAHPFSVTTNNQASKFTSYFWRNDQWAMNVRRTSRRKLISKAAAADLAYDPPAAEPEPSTFPLAPSYPPPLAVTAYRPVPPLTLPRLLSIYAQLSKSRLTTLIVLTAMSSVAIFPLPTSVPVLLATAAGTTLCCAAANTLNQLQEVPYDAQMARTRNRPLVRHAISPLHAAGFAIATGTAGPLLLWTCVNPTTALLGAANIALYAGAYTYLKRRSVLNTWVGAVVGGLPPLMGWTACGGQLLPSAAHPLHLFLPFAAVPPLPLEVIHNPLAPLALFLFLYSWQFPHFNSLSHMVRASYAQAGYRMLSALDPPRNARVALQHALLLLPMCSLLFPLSGLTTWAFAATALVPNVMCARYAWAFWRTGGEREARKMFHASLWYLPVVMGLMMVHKNGLEWTGWLSSANEGEKEGDQEQPT